MLEKRGIKVNLEKTKVMALGRSPSEEKGSGQYPCSVCSKGVGSNSITYRTCDLWCHKRCSGLQYCLWKKNEDTFECPTCSRRRTEKQNKKSNCLRVNGGKLDMVDGFCYLGCDELWLWSRKCCKSHDSCSLGKMERNCWTPGQQEHSNEEQDKDISGTHETNAVVWWWNMANHKKTGTAAKKLWFKDVEVHGKDQMGRSNLKWRDAE